GGTMATRSIHVIVTLITVSLLTPLTLTAQVQYDVVTLRPWPAPLYWQPNQTEMQIAAATKADATSSQTNAATPAGARVFVGMTPCRIADTRDGTYPAGFGPPSLVGNATRTFAIQSLGSPCPVPSIAQAYSLNITVVPPGNPLNVNPPGVLGH